MITKMKKLTFLIYHKSYDEFLIHLRDLGVVHVVEKQKGFAENKELQDDLRLSNRFNAALKLLKRQKHEKNVVISEENGSAERGGQVLEKIDSLQSASIQLNQQLQSYAKERDTLQVWGNFDPENIKKLKNAGYVVRFYSCSERTFKEEWKSKYNAIVIETLSSKVYFVTITKVGEIVDIDADQPKLPDYSLARLAVLYETKEKEIAENERQLVSLSEKEIPSIEAAQKKLQRQIEFKKVVLSTEKTVGDKLMLIGGWAPVACQQKIEAYLDTADVYYEITDPDPELDDVPILLHNLKFFSWFEPIGKLYMLPKYGELDLTPYFAPFFMIFFGLCLGDSGYGLFLLICATLYRTFAKKISPLMKSVLPLIQVLGTSTFFCGFLTGTFFGFNIYNIGFSFMLDLKNAITLNNNQMFQLSLIMGVIQIMFGMSLKIVNRTIQHGFTYAISTIGWFILIMSTLFSALFPSILVMGGTVHLVIMGICGVLIFFFNSPGKNIFLNIGLGIWDSYNMATGLLGDTLSYVRLFALGLSGSILASVFDSLAVGMSPDNIILGPIFVVFIFLAGHSINMFMNILGAVVHPMRLTFVEFFKNSEFQGGGKEYKPFKN